MGVRQLRRKILFSLLLLLIAGRAAAAQVELTLRDADSLFAARNLELIAARYDISMADAQMEQARLWANPVVSVTQNVYNKVNGRWFDFGPQSEQTVGIDQLISIAGQHSSGVKAAAAGREMAMAQFDDLLRRLRGELHKTFVSLYFAQHNMKLYESEIVSLRQTLDALVVQVKKGNISQIEAARIQALLLSLSKEQDGYSAQVEELEGRLRVLLALTPDTKIQALFEPGCTASMPDADAVAAALTDSLDSRSDVRMAMAATTLADARLRQERSKAWPEVHITGQYDRNAGYFPNFYTIGATLSLPLFNRNQGAIHAAREAAEQSRRQLADIRQKAAGDVAVASAGFVRSLKLERTVSDDYDKTNIDNLFQSVNDNYRRRNISLLEFVDFYNTYKDAMLEMSSVKENVFLTAEDLNVAAGRQVIKY